MIKYKTDEEIAVMKESGKRLKKAVDELLPAIKEGISTRDVDNQAEALIKKYEGEPSFTKVKNYHWSTCLPINEQIVHTPPSKRIIKNGDVLTLDIGFFYKGYHTDYATTFIVGGKGGKEVENFLTVGAETLEKAIEKAKNNFYLGDISKTIEDSIRGNGYFVIKELTGHGIGKDLHEDPFIPGFLDQPVEKTVKIKHGLVIAIEVIYSMGTNKISFNGVDNWTIATADGSLSACFEKTVAVLPDGNLVLT